MKINKLPRFTKTASVLALSLAAVMPAAHAQSQDVVHFYNWADYIAEDTVSRFTKETGIKVVSDIFDSGDTLEAKLLTGNSGYDVVVPGVFYMARQTQAGVYMPLDKNELPNTKHLDKGIMASLSGLDKDNKYGVPYLWGTTGIGYNIDLVKKYLGEDAPVDSWDLVFKPENMKKLAACGVTFINSADEVFPLVLNYLGQDPNSEKKSDYKKNSAGAKLLRDVKPYIKQFSSTTYISDLASGEICVAVGYNGDMLQARARAEEAGNGINIAYTIPKEGTSMWFDMLAIPSDAKNAAAAHKFVNFLMRPDVIADVTNYVWYANPNTSATKLLDKDISSDAGIYPSDEVRKNLFTQNIRKPKLNKMLNRLWVDVKTGR